MAMNLRASEAIDRRQCRRVVPMKCLVLGLGRTGTRATCEALRMLGLNETYHMENAANNSMDNILWMDALRAKFDDGAPKFGREQWDQLLGHCQAVTDFPAAIFAPELIAAYPKAKVILTNRDVDAWYSSIMSTLEWRYRDPLLYALTWMDDTTALYGEMFYKTWKGFVGGDFANNGKEAYRKHYARVRELVPPERLLEYHPSQGWSPLCEFLEVDVPAEQSFPAGNEQSSFHAEIRALDRSRMWDVLKKALPYTTLAFAVVTGLVFSDSIGAVFSTSAAT